MTVLLRAACCLVTVAALSSCQARPLEAPQASLTDTRQSARYSLLANLEECPTCTLFTADGAVTMTIEDEPPVEADVRFTFNVVDSGSGFVANLRYEENFSVFVEPNASVTVNGNLVTVSANFITRSVQVSYNTDTDAFEIRVDVSNFGNGTGISQLQFGACELPPLAF